MSIFLNNKEREYIKPVISNWMETSLDFYSELPKDNERIRKQLKGGSILVDSVFLSALKGNKPPTTFRQDANQEKPTYCLKLISFDSKLGYYIRVGML